MHSKSRFSWLVPWAALAITLGTLAIGEAEAAGQPVDAPVETVVEAEVSVRGVITAIDLAQRLVTLDTGTGSRLLPVDPGVTDLGQLGVGDVIDVRYHRSILFDIQPAGSAEPGAWIAEDGRTLGRDLDGAGRIGEQEVTVIATVVEVDGASGSFTVQGPAGNVRTLHAERPDHVDAVKRIKVGDLLRVRFREGLAVSLARVEMH